MDKNTLEHALRAEFSRDGWCLESIAKLPRAFVRPTNVTPFFQPRVLRVSDTHYIIDGFVGFIDRAFESWWQKNHGLHSVNSHCLALNIANIDILRAAQHLHTLSLVQLRTFCGFVIKVLSDFSDTEGAVASVFETNILFGLPLQKFLIYGREEKLDLLQAFARAKQLH